MPELVLLTHATEFDRPSNTGRLVLQTAQAGLNNHTPTDNLHWQVRAPLWQRRQPDTRLLAGIGSGVADPRQSYVLLYPAPDAVVVNVDDAFAATSIQTALPAGFILLDATWQQAQKMYNQSPYLQQLVKWQISSCQPSVYQLRRNQRQAGWCTAELVQMLWQYCGSAVYAADLAQRFAQFNLKVTAGDSVTARSDAGTA